MRVSGAGNRGVSGNRREKVSSRPDAIASCTDRVGSSTKLGRIRGDSEGSQKAGEIRKSKFWTSFFFASARSGGGAKTPVPKGQH